MTSAELAVQAVRKLTTRPVLVMQQQSMLLVRESVGNLSRSAAGIVVVERL